MLLCNVVAAVFCLILVGFVFFAILWVLNAVLVIIAAIQASEGIISLADNLSFIR